MWVHLINQRREEHGVFHYLVAELHLDKDSPIKYFRMEAEKMDHLFSLIGPDLTLLSKNFHEAIQPKQRLAVTVR